MPVSELAAIRIGVGIVPSQFKVILKGRIHLLFVILVLPFPFLLGPFITCSSSKSGICWANMEWKSPRNDWFSTFPYPRIPHNPQALAPFCILSTMSCCHPSFWCRWPWKAPCPSSPHFLSWIPLPSGAEGCLGCPCERFALADLSWGLKEQ